MARPDVRPVPVPQNNWGTYGEDDDFDIFVLGRMKTETICCSMRRLGRFSCRSKGAESVNGPLAILDEYYGVYVTCPDDAQYRLDWIKDYYTPDMNTNMSIRMCL